MRLWIVAVLLLVTGCGTRVETDVTAFHSLVDAPRGMTFVMVPAGPQAQSLEWRSYSRLVAAQLSKQGLRQTQTINGTDYAVFLLYSIDGGRTSSTSVPVYGQTSPGGTSTTIGRIGNAPVYGSTYTAPTYGITGYDSVEETTYGRTVRIVMFDVKRHDAGDKNAIVYDAKAKSSGGIGHLNVVMPYIVESMFVDWPGVPGTTQRRTVKMRE